MVYKTIKEDDISKKGDDRMALNILNIIAILLGGGGISCLLMGFLIGAGIAFMVMSILEIIISYKEKEE